MPNDNLTPEQIQALAEQITNRVLTAVGSAITAAAGGTKACYQCFGWHQCTEQYDCRVPDSCEPSFKCPVKYTRPKEEPAGCAPSVYDCAGTYRAKECGHGCSPKYVCDSTHDCTPNFSCKKFTG